VRSLLARMGLALLVLTLVPASPAAAACPEAGGGQIPHEPTPSTTKFVFTGHGWGHGVGMSQYGARGAAELGCSHLDILETYYTGVDVQARTPASGIVVGLYPNAPTTQGGSTISWLTLENTGGSAITWALDGGSGSNHSMPVGASWKVTRLDGEFTVVQDGSTVILNSVPGTSLTASLSGKVLRLPAKSTRYARGSIELVATSATRYRVTLALPTIEQYLYGLAEMPMSWPQQALRAQTVAGRSYAYIARGGTKSNCVCHLYDSVFDQAYRGYEPESSSSFPNWKNAVDGTAQQVLTRDGNVVTGHYSSSSGGHTESAQFVWGGSIPHEQAVDDSAWELASSNPLTSWETTLTPAGLGSAAGVGTAKSASILSTGPSGRVGSIRVVGTNATKTLTGEEFRRLLGLRSSLFTVLGPGQGFNLSSGWSSIVGADLDGDGDDELLFYNANDGAWLAYAGLPDGRLGSRLGSYVISSGWSSIVGADLDGDGDDELLFYNANGGAWLAYAGLPDGRLGSRLGSHVIAAGWSTVLAPDLDGNGDDELAFYAGDGEWLVYMGAADGTLGPRLYP